MFLVHSTLVTPSPVSPIGFLIWNSGPVRSSSHIAGQTVTLDLSGVTVPPTIVPELRSNFPPVLLNIEPELRSKSSPGDFIPATFFSRIRHLTPTPPPTAVLRSPTKSALAPHLLLQNAIPMCVPATPPPSSTPVGGHGYCRVLAQISGALAQVGAGGVVQAFDARVSSGKDASRHEACSKCGERRGTAAGREAGYGGEAGGGRRGTAGRVYGGGTARTYGGGVIWDKV
ncbi:hypothetical protein FB45DRAFT_882430 [Roridomyces roridus]|uniref:Uncharacterized protein n=1 Tax=Roridomyces roridus TaxID=1738132 RepID=A0AAD7AXE7_9AGAR|nr:hypothetical protein FB45DRAFT_882430 [Roridomyces roridus]